MTKGQQPVAWMYDFLNPDNRDEVIRDWVTQDYNDIAREVGFNVRPLYTGNQMNEQQLAAVKLAWELMHNPGEVGVDEWIAAEAAIKQALAQDALDKKAENARELGLSYDDWPKIGCVNHDCDKCKAVQEPVAEYRGVTNDGHYIIKPMQPLKSGALFYTTPPAAPVPLTDEDVAILEAVRREMEDRVYSKNAPGHAHHTPGIWDEDNGDLAGKPCAWCLTWKKFTGLIEREAAHGIAAAPEKGQP